MGYWPHLCVACQETHSAGLWYFRLKSSGDREYLCGAMHANPSGPASWLLLDPAEDLTKGSN